MSKLLPAKLDATWVDHRPIDVWQRTEASRAAGKWGEVGRTVRAEFDRVAGILAPSMVARFAAALDTLQVELDSMETSADFRLKRGPAVRRFALDLSDDGTSYTVLADDRRGPLFVSDSVDSDARRAVCWTAIIASRAATAAGDKARAGLVDALEQKVRRWDRFRNDGLSMFPLEIVINGWCGALCRTGDEPPHAQIVAVHAFPGVEVSAVTWSEVTPRNTILVEPLGIVRYSHDRAWYAGVGVAVSLPSSGPAGIGGILHLGKFGSIGYVARKATAGGGRGGYFATMDLYKYLAHLPSALQAVRERVLAKVAECRAAEGVDGCAK